MNKITLIKEWIEGYIIQLNLCPFAKVPFSKNRIAYFNMEKDVINDFKLFSEEFLKGNDDTSFIILPNMSFEDFLNLFYFVEEEVMNYSDNIKLVPFHPDLKHGSNNKKYLDYSNRSPFPLIQFLKTDVLDTVSEEDSARILQANEHTLKTIGIDSLQKRIDEFK